MHLMKNDPRLSFSARFWRSLNSLSLSSVVETRPHMHNALDEVRCLFSDAGFLEAFLYFFLASITVPYSLLRALVSFLEELRELLDFLS